MTKEIKVNLDRLQTIQSKISSEVDNLADNYYSIKNSANELSGVWKGDSKNYFDEATENLLVNCFENTKELKDIADKIQFAIDNEIAVDEKGASEIKSSIK